MQPGAKSQDLDAVAVGILSRFREGVAAEFSVSAPGLPASLGRRDLIVIPSPLFREGGPHMILVAVVGKGSFLWNGQNPITEWQMLMNGIRPLSLAKDVAYILNRVREIFPTVYSLQQAVPPVPQLTQEKPNAHRPKHRNAQRKRRPTEWTGP